MSKTAPSYETLFRGKFMFSDCKTFEDLIKRCEAQIEEFKTMKADNVKLDPQGAEDDYFFLRTTDKKVAKKHLMELVER